MVLLPVMQVDYGERNGFWNMKTQQPSKVCFKLIFLKKEVTDAETMIGRIVTYYAMSRSPNCASLAPGGVVDAVGNYSSNVNNRK